MNKETVIKHINETEGLLYIDNIVPQIIWHTSGFDLRLPESNSDWSMDVMKLAIRLCTRYAYNYFILGQGSGDEVAGYISIYVQGIK